MAATKEKKNLKRKKPINDAAPVFNDDDVPAFPRGGSGLSQEEKEKIHAEVDAEFYAGLGGSKKKKKMAYGKVKRRKSNGNEGEGNEEDLGSLFGDGITGKLPRFANRITMKNVSAGMKLWGVVVEVNVKDIVVGLPGGLRGLVRADEAVDYAVANKDAEDGFLSSLFHVGQLVSCIVLQVDEDKTEMGKRKVWLSLRLSLLYKGFSLEIVEEGMVLTAYVKSIEDHGYLLFFGLPSFTGFLPKSSQEDEKEMKLNAGQLVQGVVRSIDKSRKVVHLCSDADVVSKCVTKDLKGISLDLLIPGMMVNARVHAVLSNGIMLSFLTYFTGTVDIFHLKEQFPLSDWTKEYGKNKKVNARILFIDPSTRAIGLSMNPLLLQNNAPPQILKAGESYDQAKIIRIDKGSGLLLQIPCEPSPVPAYVAISDVADKEIHTLETKFKEGSLLRARILGYRHLEGLSMGILKASAFEGSVFTHSDVKPGMVVKAKVIAVKSVGAFLQFPGGVKALCPLQHMSESEISKPCKKFQVGAELAFRILGCKSKRITVTHKKTLVKSKVKILASYADATEGLLTHGWITKIEEHGCFVRFYNGVQGFVPRSELGLEPGSDPISRYHVGEVVKCRITSSVPAHRRINLSFILSPSRALDDDLVKPGNLVSGMVEHVTSRTVFLHVDVKGNMKGTISIEHLADHQGHATAMKSVLRPGHKLTELLILDVEGNNLVLTSKYSLVHARQQLPSDMSQMSPRSLIHGYICNIIETGCFVRFLGHLTGFSPRRKAIDDQKVAISKAFYIGQSVRCNILDADSENGRITLSLKQSSCSSKDASFLQSYFLTEDKIAELQQLDSSSSDGTWVEIFNIGSIVEGKIQQAKDVGVVVSFEGCTSVFGFITQYQLGGRTVEVGSGVRAMVLDISKVERLVDLSLRLESFERSANNNSDVQSSKKKRKRASLKDLKVLATVNAIVEIVKEEYLVLSLPEHDYAIGYAAVSDYNIQNLSHGQFSSGQSIVATVMSLPSPSTAGRLLLFIESLTKPVEISSSKRLKKKSGYDVGALVEAEITEIKRLELRLKLGNGLRGRVHITEVADGDPVGNPFSCYKVGQNLEARILANNTQFDSHRKGYQWELSIKPSVLAGTTGTQDNLTKELNYAVGQHVSGYVYKVDNDWVWLAVSRHVNAQLFVLDSTSQPDELQEFSKRYKLGDILSGYILNINADKRLLRLVLHEFRTTTDGAALEDNKTSDLGTENSTEKVVLHIHEGDIVGGRIWKILPGVGGLLVQLGPHLSGKVHFAEISDTWVWNPLSSYQEGQFVKCKVLEVSTSLSGTVHVDLSLRSSLEGMQSDTSGPILKGCTAGYRASKMEDLHPKMEVKGYVKDVSSKGCFIMLARKIDAKILLGNLSDSFVKDPEKEFPVGKLVEGKVLSVDPSSKRIEVTLRTSGKTGRVQSEIVDLSSIHVGDVISGMIKRVEPYGLFIRLDNSTVVGLCHVSELSDDDHVSDRVNQHKAGERVRAKILKVDEEKQRVALGMKASYFNDSPEESGECMNGSTGKALLDSQVIPNAADSDTESEVELESPNVHSTLEASVPPLEVQLDDADGSFMDSIVNLKVAADVDAADEKCSRQERRKAKEDRERAIRSAEEHLLEGDIPRTSDEFEKLIRSSPNNSFVWIKYMSFKLDSADVEGARSVAERALRTINMTHEAEKLNIWVAYLNLENEFGNHREEAVKRIFQRAKQFCDPMKIHMELLGLYERTGQNDLAGELLERMVRRFRNSMEVWLRRAQFLLNHSQEGIETIVNRALLSLPCQDHIKFLSQVAILEFKCGVPDRGRSIFEKILREYPKRRDLWSVYLDQEIRLGDVDLTRALFERATSLSHPAKKMKFFFKKYLNYEKSLGDEERVQYVVEKAREYIETTNA